MARGAAAAALAAINAELGKPAYSALQAAGLCRSCRHSAAPRRYDPATLLPVGPELRCLRDEDAMPLRRGAVPDVRACGSYCYEPGAAG